MKFLIKTQLSKSDPKKDKGEESALPHACQLGLEAQHSCCPQPFLSITNEGCQVNKLQNGQGATFLHLFESNDLEYRCMQSHYREVPWWQIFMEKELNFGLDLGRLALLKKKLG